MKKATKAQQNARALIAKFRGRANEYDMLKGVLCCDHAMDLDDSLKLKKLLCLITIAERMDQMNADALAKFKDQEKKSAVAVFGLN